MPAFEQTAWTEVMSLIETDDAAGIAARAGALQASGVLECSHPLDEMRRTPVMFAYWYGHIAAANALVRAGSEYQTRDAKGRNVTWYAQNMGKGQTELTMSTRISATGRRLSMESAIKAKKPESGEPAPKPRRRSSGV